MASMFKAKPEIVNRLFTVKAVLVNSVGLRVFQKKSKINQFFVNLENETILC